MPETKEVSKLVTISPCCNSFCCKSTVNLKECVAAIALLQLKNGHSSNGWLQLRLQINSISFKKGMTACFTETQYP